MRKQPTHQQTRQQQRQEAAYRRETEQRQREVARRRESAGRSPNRPQRLFSNWTFIALAIILIGLIAFLVIEQQAPANAAYAPVGKISCDDGEHTDFHVHAHLTLYLNGQKMIPPAGVGIAPDNSCIYWLHTHNADGILHIEAPKGSTFTLKNFLDIWAGHFPKLNYPSELNQTADWQAYVDGKPFHGDFHTIPLQAHALITLAYQSPGARPDTTFNWNGL